MDYSSRHSGRFGRPILSRNLSHKTQCHSGISIRTCIHTSYKRAFPLKLYNYSFREFLSTKKFVFPDRKEVSISSEQNFSNDFFLYISTPRLLKKTFLGLAKKGRERNGENCSSKIFRKVF